MADFATCRCNAQMDIQEQIVKHVLRIRTRANAAILAIRCQVVAGMGAASGAQASVSPAKIGASHPPCIFFRMFSLARAQRETLQLPLPSILIPPCLLLPSALFPLPRPRAHALCFCFTVEVFKVTGKWGVNDLKARYSRKSVSSSIQLLLQQHHAKVENIFLTQSGRPYAYLFFCQSALEIELFCKGDPGSYCVSLPLRLAASLSLRVFLCLSCRFAPYHTQCTHTHTHTPQESANVTTDGMANFAMCRRRSNAQMDMQEQNAKYVMRIHIRTNAAILVI